ncbi:hypothetical protein SAMN03080617_01020 [Algoriphagus alkaliphilus]|uniref:Uncharacterized protein n=1 Tax=Algoriphagus alkaliphilus TaxID=279824 RepID=A0A1G5WEP1_9BACT|nr:hypothetical protein [Algoriphagus alkaliphilus]MBA4302534.1 hypothetical protein [Cyclobacterium sp.]SDA55715.1 hypothetical protein SAMN03080617_01020 [Algoriphagus alkaliphilus]
MEKISIEVNADLAKAWEDASADFKKEFSELIESQIKQALGRGDKEKVLEYLDELRSKLESRGLTQEILSPSDFFEKEII